MGASIKKLLAANLIAAIGAVGLMAGAAHAADGKKVALFINGTLGDKSFFDSANRGLKKAVAELGVEAKVVESGYDATRWESSLADVADSGSYDTIVVLTYDMTAPVQKISAEYKDIKFILLDSAVDYKACACKNVYSAVFRQNEASYLAGVLAASMVKEKASGVAADSSLGTVGAMEIPVINDFIVGFEAGAKSVTPDVKLLRQYANSFNDPAAGKEVAKAEYGQGASIVFQVAGGTGQGVIEAAAESSKLVIGVDSDQAMIYNASKPDTAKHIVTSVMKNVDNVVFRSLKNEIGGTLPFGTAEALGLKEGGMSLADNEITRGLVPGPILDAVKKAEAGIIDGSIKVPTAF